uniref:CCHC-type domain-containing protein n=1 Tax=Amphiprion ocellaris TaxID=80972 RepID=A0AAQ5ZS49_AMPOC
MKAQPQFNAKIKSSPRCYKCGGSPHPKRECPANNAKYSNITFKLDTGADVTAIAESDLAKVFPKDKMPILQQPEKPLLGPGKTPLDVIGFTRLQLKY